MKKSFAKLNTIPFPVIKSFFLTGLITAICFSMSFAQSKTVQGIVKDAQTNAALAGVTVSLKSGNVATSTGSDGRYSISSSAQNDTLIFSVIGYATREINIAGRSVVDVEMSVETMQLDDVVVIGYGTTKKSDVTGAVSSIKSSALEKRPAPTLDILLQGKIPGLQVTQATGEPGSGVQVLLRGMSSLNGSNSPLYVIDGIPYGTAGNLKQLNVNDIESIEVLKDASAASIYGSRGANGVIIITTKSGKADMPAKLSVSANTGFQYINQNRLQIQKDPYSYALLDNEARKNSRISGVNPLYIGADDGSGFYFPSLTEIQSGAWDKSTDWADEVLQTAPIQNYNVSLIGGGEKNSYMLSLSYFNQLGTLKGSGYDNYTARFKYDNTAFDNLKVGTNIAVSYVNRDNAKIGYEHIFRNPVFPIYAEDGSYYRESAADQYNPTMLVNEVKNIASEYDLQLFGYADWTITNGLVLHAQSGVNVSHSIGQQYWPRTTYLGNIHQGIAIKNDYTGSSMLNQAYLTYTKNIADNHKLVAMAGYTAEINKGKGSETTAVGFANDKLKDEDFSSGKAGPNPFMNSQFQEVLNSVISRINYDFDNRFLFTFTARYDGSSKFGTSNQYAFFPAIAMGWKIDKEAFMENVTWVDELKLRASHGSAGNQAISVYGTKDKISSHPNAKYYLGNSHVSGYGLTQMGNDKLKWETTTQTNLGLDVRVFKNRLSFTLDIYNKTTTDLLRRLNLPLSAGLGNQHVQDNGTVWVNSGEINNKGIELGINGVLISKNDFSWNATLNISHNKATVVDIGEAGDGNGLFMSRGNFLDGGVFWRNGQPMDQIVGYRVNGIIQQGKDYNWLSGLEALPGEFLYQKLNGNGPLNESDDTEVLGNAQPKAVFGLNSEITYKRFDLNVQMNGTIGNKIIAGTRFSNLNMMNRWTVDNPTNAFPSLRAGRVARMSDWWVADGTFMRISTITLGYQFNKSAIGPFNNIRAFVSCINPYVFTRYGGTDPEVYVWDWGAYPRATSYTFGINVDL